VSGWWVTQWVVVGVCVCVCVCVCMCVCVFGLREFVCENWLDSLLVHMDVHEKQSEREREQ
jgi:Na+/melibiose symporter-like transporter